MLFAQIKSDNVAQVQPMDFPTFSSSQEAYVHTLYSWQPVPDEVERMYDGFSYSCD